MTLSGKITPVITIAIVSHGLMVLNIKRGKPVPRFNFAYAMVRSDWNWYNKDALVQDFAKLSVYTKLR